MEQYSKKIKEVLIDLRYRGDYTPQARSLMQRYAYVGDSLAFGRVLSNRSLWPDVPQERFQIRVKFNLILIVAALYSVGVFSAYSPAEIEQLAQINHDAIEKAERAHQQLDKAIIFNLLIINKKEIILSLKASWEQTIQKKCQLESFDSLNTDAETAVVNRCLARQYADEARYFNQLLPCNPAVRSI